MARTKAPRMAVVVREDWAARVREVLKVQDHTLQWLADQIPMDRSQLSFIMNGDPRYILSPDLLERIAAILGVPYSWVFGSEECSAHTVAAVGEKQ